jgi:hypothetical protein
MKTSRSRSTVSLLILSLTISPIMCYGAEAGLMSGATAGGVIATLPSPAAGFTEAELDEMLGPIALYPDPLLAQVLPSTTFIDQLGEAQKTLNGKSDDELIAKQNWDISVKAVAHYPQVLQMMTEKQDWTTALGQAYVSQQPDVEKAIQRLRAEAKAAGNLVTSDKMIVETKTVSGKQVIVVEPAQPEVIYVPQYNPEVVYVQQGPSTGAVVGASVLAFGAGLALGAWLNRGWHWYGGGPYYHGWAGSGWIARSSRSASVNINRNVYVNNSYRNVNVNRSITSRNISTYRNDMQRTANLHHEQKVTANNLKRTNATATGAGANRNTAAHKTGTKAGTAAGTNARGATNSAKSTDVPRTGNSATAGQTSGNRAGAASTGARTTAGTGAAKTTAGTGAAKTTAGTGAAKTTAGTGAKTTGGTGAKTTGGTGAKSGASGGKRTGGRKG